MENQKDESAPVPRAEEDRTSQQPNESAQAEVEVSEEELRKKKKEKILRWVKMIGFLLVIIGLIIFVIIEADLVSDWLESFLNWVEENEILGMFIFVLVYTVATVLFVPGLILTLGAGFIYAEIYGLGLGILVASIVVFIGASIGATMAMIMGRYVFRKSLQESVKKYPTFLAIEEAIQEEGLKLVILLRLSPIIPFNAFNYFMGITSVKFRDYTIGCVGMIPGTVAYVYFGSALGSISEAASGNADGGGLQLGFIIGGSVLAIVAIIYVSYIAKKKINQVLAKNKAAQDVNEPEGNSPQVNANDMHEQEI